MSAQQQHRHIVRIAFTGLAVAAVFAATLLIQIPNAMEGYFNLGDGMILIFAACSDPLGGFIIGGVSSAMADLASGYAHYVIPTLLIKGLEGWLVAVLFRRYKDNAQWPAYLLGSLVMTGGYFIAKWVMKQSFWIAVAELPANILQAAAGIIIAFCLYPTVKKLAQKHHL